MESYHVNIPNESDIDARTRVFDDLVKRIDISSFFLKMKAAVSNNIVPADVMLMAESIIGENRKEDAVKYSMMMDSTDIAIA
jgi:hypothetical protein